MHRYFLFFIFYSITGFACYAQTDSLDVNADDSVAVEDDSAISTYEEYDEMPELTDADVLSAPIDTTLIEKRTFSNEKLSDLKSDSDLDYKATPTIAESLWQRLIRWLNEMLGSLFENAVTTNWGRVFVYFFGLVVAVVVIMLILRVDAFNVFYSGRGANKINYQTLEDNIHEMDFEKLIQEAISKNDYRRGVRLTFLYALKILSDGHHIRWESGKTNHDYLAELSAPELRTGFNELNFYFEYAWYGNFNVTQDIFNKVQNIFFAWKGKVQ